MDDVANQSEVKEAAPLETSQQDVSTENTQVQEKQVQEDKQERNWRELRRVKDELEKKSKMQEELIAGLMAQIKPAQQQPPVDELDSVPDEDFIPKGQVKKLMAKERETARQIAKEEAERILQEREKAQFLPRLKSQFSDFDEIVNPETLALLEENDPDLAMTIAELKDPYKIGLQSYKYIKALKLTDKVSGSRRTKEVDKKIEQNAKSVQTPQAFEKRPMAQAFRQTEAEKTQIYNEMMHYAHQAGGGY